MNSRAGSEKREVFDGRLIRADLSSGRTEVLARGQFEDIQVSADGRYLAALRQGHLPQPDPARLVRDWGVVRSQLVLLDLKRGGDPKVVLAADDVFPGSLVWAPDADRLAFFAWEVDKGAQQGLFHAFDAVTETITPYPHLGLDLASERERGWLQRPERAVWIGKRLAVFARATDRPDGPPQFTYRIGQAPDASGAKTADGLARAGWYLIDTKGRHEELTAPFQRVSAIPLSATARELFVLADGHVWKLEPGVSPVDLTPQAHTELRHPAPVLYTMKRPRFQPFVTLVSERSSGSSFTLVDLRNGQVSTLESPGESSRLLASSVAASASIFVRDDSATGSDLILSDADGGNRVLERLNTHLTRVGRPKWTMIKYVADDGRALESCVLLPYGYQPGMRYAAIVDVYPGRAANCLSAAQREYYTLGNSPGAYTLDLLSGQNYVVMEAAAPTDLIRSPTGPLTHMPAVVLKGVDALVAQGYADPKRVGLIGFSQGGFASLWIATQTARFSAVVSLDGWADLWSHYFQGQSEAYGKFHAEQFPYGSEALRYETAPGTEVFAMGVTPWQQPGIYLRNSPVFRAPDVQTPIMLIHTDMDSFGLSQYDEMFGALYRERKEAQFVRYWGEGHGPSSPANLRDMWERIFAWYGQHL